MRASKLLLLLALLGFGASLELAHQARGHLVMGPSGCRTWRGRLQGPSFSFEAQEPRTGEFRTVAVENAFGGVRVVAGEPGQAQLRLRTVVYLGDQRAAQAFAGKLRLVVVEDGDTLRVATNRRELEDQEVGFETHLELSLPKATRVVVRCEHGGVDVADVAEVDLEASYDAVRASGISGAATLSCRHGSLSASDVGGALKLTAKYGDVEANDVAGQVTLESRNGEATLRRLGGLTASIHNGSLTAEGVRGDLLVRGNHSEVRASDLGGGADVETSYRDVDLSTVAGDARVKIEHGALSARSLRGKLTAESSYGDLSVSDLAGPADLKVEHGGVHAQRLSRGAKVRASGDDVVLDGFKGVVDVVAQRASVSLTPDGPIQDRVDVRTSNGGVELRVDAEDRFELEAASDSGEVQVDLPGLVVHESSQRHVKGSLGQGGSPVTLNADHGDVRVALASDKSKGD
jgi:DUF4097 and DUF4098 domain-containing protein YvlB